MNVILNLNDDELKLLRRKLEHPDGHPNEPYTSDESEQLLKKFEQAVDDGVSGLLNWIEIPEDLNDVPDDVTFGKFSNDPKVGYTHYYKPIEADK